MGILQTIIIAFLAAAAVILLLKLWESELSITLTSKRLTRRNKRPFIEIKEDTRSNHYENEEDNVNEMKKLKD